MRHINNNLKIIKKRNKLAYFITYDEVDAFVALTLVLMILLLSFMTDFTSILIRVLYLTFIMLGIILLVRKIIANFRLSKISLYLPLNKEDWERIGVTPKNVNDIVTVFVKIIMELKLEKYLTFYFRNNLDSIFKESFNQAVKDFPLNNTKIYGEHLGEKIIATYQNEFCGKER